MEKGGGGFSMDRINQLVRKETVNTVKPRFNTRLALLAVTVAAAMWIVAGALQLTNPDEVRDTTTDTVIGHFAVALFSGALALTIPLALALGDYARSRRPAYLMSAGLGLLALASTISNIVGHDPVFFLVAAPIANLMWLGGAIWLAVSLSKAGLVPRWVAIALPFVQVFALPLSFIGGMIVAGGYYIAAAQVLKAEAAAEPAPEALPA